jgi:phosphoglycolate phosphatase-like HAD superfamily hydrolase
MRQMMEVEDEVRLAVELENLVAADALDLRPLPGYDGFAVSRSARVYSMRGGALTELPQFLDHLGLSPLLALVRNSAQTGYEKPHPRAFQGVMEAFPEAETVGDRRQRRTRYLGGGGLERCHAEAAPQTGHGLGQAVE